MAARDHNERHPTLTLASAFGSTGSPALSRNFSATFSAMTAIDQAILSRGLNTRDMPLVPEVLPNPEEWEVSVEASITGENKIQVKTFQKTWLKTWQQHGLKGVLKEAMRTPLFDNMMCLVVLGNALCIALEQTHRLEGRPTDTFDMLEHVFLAIYTVELGLNLYSLGWTAFNSNWIKFDIVLVLTGLISLAANIIAGNDKNAPIMKILVLRMVRLLRLARLARTVRLIVQFQELWMLARGLLNSFSTAIHTLMFGLVLLFVVGCMTVELIPLTMLNDPEVARNEVVRTIVQENFASLPKTMLTLVQFITFDNVVYIYKPLIEEDPSLALFFIVVLLLVGVVFMNLVTAIIVNSGLEQSLQDKNMRKVVMEQKRKQLLLDLEKAFHRIDTNASGTLCRDELSDIDKESLAVLEGYLGVENLPQMFDVLDVDGSGEIGIEEFCDGIASIVLTETQPEIKRIERLAETLKRTISRCESNQVELKRSLAHVLASIEDTNKRVSCLYQGTNCPTDSTAETDDDHDHEMKLLDMPEWAKTFLEELRDTCSKDIQYAMDEAWKEVWCPLEGTNVSCAAFTTPEASECGGDFDVPTEADLIGRDPVWEALPPESVRYMVEGKKPEPPPRSLDVPNMLNLSSEAQLVMGHKSVLKAGGGGFLARRAYAFGREARPSGRRGRLPN